MKYKKEWKTSGIYYIKCLSNNKMYIGKSINMYMRLKAHTTGMNTRNSNENIHLINAWHKYGENNFVYDIMEYCNDDILSEKELYYINKYDTIKNGFNIRLDSSSGMKCSEETKQKLSNSQKERYKNPEERKKTGLRSIKSWKSKTEDEMNEMKDNLSKSRTRNKWYQYDKQNNLIKIWNSVRDILKENPEYKRHNIYACASGEKPTIYGFIWKKDPLK